MKKLLLLNLIALFIGGVSMAQDLDITQVFFSNSGSTAGNIQSDSLQINTNAFLIAVYQNNLAGNQALVTSDSISFGYSVDGTKIGETGRLAGRTLNSGGQVPFIVDENYAIGATEKQNVEVCVWSLYNPYNPQTTDNNISELCRSTFTFFEPVNTTGLRGVQAVGDVSAFYAKNSIQLLMSDAHVNKKLSVQVIDLTGQIVLEQNIDIRNNGDVYESIPFGEQPHGIYLINVNSDSFSKTVKFVKN